MFILFDINQTKSSFFNEFIIYFDISFFSFPNEKVLSQFQVDQSQLSTPSWTNI